MRPCSLHLWFGFWNFSLCRLSWFVSVLVSLSVFLFVYLSLSVFLSVYLYVWLALSLSLYLSISITTSLPLYLSLPLPLSLLFPLLVYLPLCTCVRFFHSISSSAVSDFFPSLPSFPPFVSYPPSPHSSSLFRQRPETRIIPLLTFLKITFAIPPHLSE